MIYIVLVIVSVVMASGAQMLLKKGAMCQYTTVIRQYANIWVLSGYIILGLSLLLNVYCMSKGVQVKEVSIIESLSYLFVPLLSWLFFKEPITLRKCIAIIVIMSGIIIFFI